jgi:hypothetical protein
MLELKLKVKAKLSLHASRAYKENASIHPLLINLATRWEYNESWTKVI